MGAGKRRFDGFSRSVDLERLGVRQSQHPRRFITGVMNARACEAAVAQAPPRSGSTPERYQPDEDELPLDLGACLIRLPLGPTT